MTLNAVAYTKATYIDQSIAETNMLKHQMDMLTFALQMYNLLFIVIQELAQIQK